MPSQVSDMAHCLNVLYLFYSGKSPHINKWIIHLPSGAWCTTEKECYERYMYCSFNNFLLDNIQEIDILLFLYHLIMVRTNASELLGISKLSIHENLFYVLFVNLHKNKVHTKVSLSTVS